MIPYVGDFAEDATVYHYFNTFTSDDPAASVTITNLVDADLKVHKDGSVTQIVTDGATIAIDFDSITGTHKVEIDTSAHADYAINADYMVRMEGTTVDGGTINAALFTFSIENRTTFPKADYPTNFAAMGIESDGDLTKVNTLDGHTAQTGDNYARLGAPAGASVSADIATVDTVADGIQTDLDNATDGLGALKTLIDTVDTVVDGIQTDLDNGTDGLGAIKTDTAAILVDTAEIGAAGAGLTAVPWNAAWDAEVESEVIDALDTAISELGVAAPSATPGLRDAVMLLYMALRNKTVVQTSGTDALEIYNDAGTKIASKLLTDDGSDYTEAEMS